MIEAIKDTSIVLAAIAVFLFVWLFFNWLIDG